MRKIFRLFEIITKLSRMMAKYKRELILVVIFIATIVNKFGVSDPSRQWFYAMLAIAVNLFIYSFSDYIETKRKESIAIAGIFGLEIIAVLMGWSLETNYYTELILLLSLVGVYHIIESVWNKLK